MANLGFDLPRYQRSRRRLSAPRYPPRPSGSRGTGPPRTLPPKSRGSLLSSPPTATSSASPCSPAGTFGPWCPVTPRPRPRRGCPGPPRHLPCSARLALPGVQNPSVVFGGSAQQSPAEPCPFARDQSVHLQRCYQYLCCAALMKRRLVRGPPEKVYEEQNHDDERDGSRRRQRLFSRTGSSRPFCRGGSEASARAA